jgi:uncharacterized protein
LNSSKLILGTVQFGLPYGINNQNGKPPVEDVFNILQYAFDNGIRELDTAEAYGDAQESIGNFIRTTGHRFLVNTKFKGSFDSVTKQLERSLAQLSVDFVNTYFFHDYNEFANGAEVREELKHLKSEKKIRNIGVSIYTNEQFNTCIESAEVDVIQLPFNLLDNYSQRGNLLQRARQRNKTLQVRSVFLQGLFFKSPSSIPGQLNPLAKYLSKIESLSASFHLSMHDMALAYAFAKPEIDKIIIGIDSISQLKENLGVARITLDKKLVDEIDQIAVKETELLYPCNWK